MKCCVKNCPNKYSKNNKKAFFGFPKEQKLRMKWLEFCGKSRSDEISRSWKVCEIHFKEDDFIGRSQCDLGISRKLLLKPGAVPSILVADLKKDVGEPAKRLVDRNRRLIVESLEQHLPKNKSDISIEVKLEPLEVSNEVSLGGSEDILVQQGCKVFMIRKKNTLLRDEQHLSQNKSDISNERIKVELESDDVTFGGSEDFLVQEDSQVCTAYKNDALLQDEQHLPQNKIDISDELIKVELVPLKVSNDVTFGGSEDFLVQEDSHICTAYKNGTLLQDEQHLPQNNISDELIKVELEPLEVSNDVTFGASEDIFVQEDSQVNTAYKNDTFLQDEQHLPQYKSDICDELIKVELEPLEVSNDVSLGGSEDFLVQEDIQVCTAYKNDTLLQDEQHLPQNRIDISDELVKVKLEPLEESNDVSLGGSEYFLVQQDNKTDTQPQIEGLENKLALLQRENGKLVKTLRKNNITYEHALNKKNYEINRLKFALSKSEQRCTKMEDHFRKTLRKVKTLKLQRGDRRQK